jgi:phosphoglycerate dehydrogenase-like enzyme
LPNVVLTPHIGAMATDAQRLIGVRVVEVIGAFDRGTLNEELSDIERVI